MQLHLQLCPDLRPSGLPPAGRRGRRHRHCRQPGRRHHLQLDRRRRVGLCRRHPPRLRTDRHVDRLRPRREHPRRHSPAPLAVRQVAHEGLDGGVTNAEDAAVRVFNFASRHGAMPSRRDFMPSRRDAMPSRRDGSSFLCSESLLLLLSLLSPGMNNPFESLILSIEVKKLLF